MGADENESVSTTSNAKRSLLFMHGSMMDAETWMQYQMTYPTYPNYKPIFLQLVDQGYDVWMGNGRGTKYSKDNIRFGAAEDPKNPAYISQNEVKYDYSFVEMGKYDLNAIFNTIKKQTSNLRGVDADNRITYIGYQQASLSMLYALTQDQDGLLANEMNKAIFLAPCLFPATLGLDNYAKVYPVFRESDVFVVNDANW